MNWFKWISCIFRYGWMLFQLAMKIYEDVKQRADDEDMSLNEENQLFYQLMSRELINSKRPISKAKLVALRADTLLIDKRVLKPRKELMATLFSNFGSRLA